MMLVPVVYLAYQVICLFRPAQVNLLALRVQPILASRLSVGWVAGLFVMHRQQALLQVVACQRLVGSITPTLELLVQCRVPFALFGATDIGVRKQT